MTDSGSGPGQSLWGVRYRPEPGSVWGRTTIRLLFREIRRWWRGMGQALYPSELQWVGWQFRPLMGTRSWGQAEKATTHSISAIRRDSFHGEWNYSLLPRVALLN